LTRAHASYYMVRKIVVVYHCQDERLKRKLLSRLTAASPMVTHLYHDIAVALSGCEDHRNYEGVSLLHGVLKDEEDMVAGDEDDLTACRPEWIYVFDVTQAAMRGSTAYDVRTLERYIAHELFTKSLDPEDFYYD
jgi:hypothetical protein